MAGIGRLAPAELRGACCTQNSAATVLKSLKRRCGTTTVVGFMRAALLGTLGILLACGTDPPEDSCVTTVRLDCSPQYSPAVYTTIFEKILRPTCASGRGTCHTADAAKGGLVFEDAETAYALLLGQRDGRVRVSPGDPSCSLLSKRLRASNPSRRMPPGPVGLSDGEVCTIARWIADGAVR